MAAAYDSYDYPSYWDNRKYEHASECLALGYLINKIKNIKKLIDIGAGYGRLTPEYVYRAKTVTLCDPSSKLLSKARKNLSGYNQKIKYCHISLENLKKSVTSNSYNVAIMVRVLHHIKDVDFALKEIYRLLKPNGYLIIEYANHHHFKRVMTEFIKGNFTFPLDIFPKDIRCQQNIINKTLPFKNYHPDDIEEKLKDHGFLIKERLSVSNIRNGFIKNILPLDLLLNIEKHFQKPLSKINFGPSIFILAQKRS